MNLNHIYEQRSQFYLTPSSTVKGAMMAFLLIGLITLGYGFGTGHGTQMWGAILFNVFFFFALGVGGMAFSAMQDLIGAEWARPVKRIHEAFGAFVPVALVIFTFFLIAVLSNFGGAGDVYSWIADQQKVEHLFGKGFWLRPRFMVCRDIISLIIITLLIMWQYKQLLPRDVAFVSGNRDEALRLGEEAKGKLRHWSAPILVVYGLLFSLLGFDLLMSLEPMWFSTLWGGWLFSIMMQTLMAVLLILMFVFKDSVIGSVMSRQQFHDVGKLMHGFTAFFGYLTYAHILTYWYGNVPEETEYFIHRMHAPWIYIVIAAPIFSFLIPLYAMIPKASKWTARIVIPIAVAILIAQWYTYLLVTMPDIVDNAEATWKYPVMELGVFFGVLGLFMACFIWFGKRYPMVSVADPILARALSHDHH